jgi:hypothetical protein
MKKLIYITIIIGIAFTSCAKEEECVCSASANITEADAKDIGTTLSEACELAKTGDATCAVR